MILLCFCQGTRSGFVMLGMGDSCHLHNVNVKETYKLHLQVTIATGDSPLRFQQQQKQHFTNSILSSIIDNFTHKFNVFANIERCDVHFCNFNARLSLSASLPLSLSSKSKQDLTFLFGFFFQFHKYLHCNINHYYIKIQMMFSSH